jgi:ankyrin repeat protein
MPTPTEQLQSLMRALYCAEWSFETFKHSAMTLARQGANITVRSNLGSEPTLLHVLVRHNKDGVNNVEIAELVGLNRDILESKDYYGKTALQSLINDLNCEVCSFETFKHSAMLLARQGANITVRFNLGTEPTLLHLLVRHNKDGVNDVEIAELVGLNRDILESTDCYGRTPVHSLLANNPDVTVDVLGKLLSPTNLSLKDNHDATLLHAACHSGNLPALEHLFGRGLSLTALTKSNETLIHKAVSFGNTGLIQWLIDTKQIDINAKNQSGDTALHCATRHNNREMVELLTRNGVDFTIQNNDGQRASEIATSMGYHDLVPYLFNSKDGFFYKIQAMHNYGVLLRDQGASKGQVAIDLASQLATMANEFFDQAAEQRNFAEFEPRFSALLHSKDKEMSAYRISWGTIATNIAIALTGVGILFIAGKLIHSKVTENRALFFFQKSKTTSEEKIADVEYAASLIAQSA